MPAYTCVSVIETYLPMGMVATLTDAFHRYLQLKICVFPSFRCLCLYLLAISLWLLRLLQLGPAGFTTTARSSWACII